MKTMPFKISGQLLIAMVLILGISQRAQAIEDDYKPIYKVDKCDCVVQDGDDPTFLSSILGGDLGIFAEADSLKQAKEDAAQQCQQAYGIYARGKATKEAVTEAGCHQYVLTKNGDWDDI